MSSQKPMTRLASRLSQRPIRQSTPTSPTLKRPNLFRRGIATSPYALRRQQHFLRSIAFVATGSSLLVLYQWMTGENPLIRDAHAESFAGSLFNSKEKQEKKLAQQAEDAKPEQAEIVFEEAVKAREGATKEENRDVISSQHLQVRKSWENPGVWIWGANDGKVAGPDRKEGVVKNPQRLPFFDGQLLRDLQLTRDFGAAISETGDLIQWGSSYSKTAKGPTTTLKGKNLVKLAISTDRVLALSKSGTVYSLSVSEEEQRLGPKPSETSWYLPFTPYKSPISYRTLKPTDMGWTERITSVAAGLEHALILTSSGRVFSAAAASEEYPSRGQFGIPGLTWFTKPSDKSYDAPHEIKLLHGFKIAAVAAGDYHSVVLDRQGRVFAWGDNQKGQLGIGDTSKDTPYFDAPQLLPIAKLYAGTNQRAHVTSVSAGGNTTFLTIDAERVASPEADSVAAAFRGLGRITADTWACGHGIWGQLGNGRWTHVAAMPTRIQPLSGLFEYDEKARRAIPIRMREISVGANHCAAVMDNVTYTEASDKSSENDTNWGADVLFFGNNEYFQLGTGKRNNLVNPTYIQPLDREAEVKEGNRPKGELHRFHATPRSTVKVNGRWVDFEQRVHCGRGVTAVYSGV